MYAIYAIRTAMPIRNRRQAWDLLLTGKYLPTIRSIFINIQSLITSRQVNISSDILESIYHSIWRHALEHVNLKMWSHGHK